MVTLEAVERRAEASRNLPDPDVRRMLRTRAGVTLDEMGEACGVTAQAVWLWETGQRQPRGERLERYVAALNACRSAL